jgi:hypothetical protein
VIVGCNCVLWLELLLIFGVFVCFFIAFECLLFAEEVLLLFTLIFGVFVLALEFLFGSDLLS